MSFPIGILVLGGGGREHAIASRLENEGHRVIVAPGNGGCTKTAPDLCLGAVSVANYCKQEDVSLVVVVEGQPLIDGIVDDLREIAPELHVFGPTKAAARLEDSKVFCKEFMTRHKLPTAEFYTFTDAEEAMKFIRQSKWQKWVVKADKIGGGSVVATSAEKAAIEAANMIHRSGRIFIERFLEGHEFSVFCFTDGSTVRRLPLAGHYKNRLDGVNFIKMGVVAPVHEKEQTAEKISDILRRAVNGMNEDATPFQGVLHARIMVSLTGDINVINLKCSFADPETEVLLPLLDCQLKLVLEACVNRTLDTVELNWKKGTDAVGFILADGAYSYNRSCKPITSIASATEDTYVYHCGTRMRDEQVVTNGERIMCVTALGENLAAAKTYYLNIN